MCFRRARPRVGSACPAAPPVPLPRLRPSALRKRRGPGGVEAVPRCCPAARPQRSAATRCCSPCRRSCAREVQAGRRNRRSPREPRGSGRARVAMASRGSWCAAPRRSRRGSSTCGSRGGRAGRRCRSRRPHHGTSRTVCSSTPAPGQRSARRRRSPLNHLAWLSSPAARSASMMAPPGGSSATGVLGRRAALEGGKESAAAGRRQPRAPWPQLGQRGAKGLTLRPRRRLVTPTAPSARAARPPLRSSSAASRTSWGAARAAGRAIRGVPPAEGRAGRPCRPAGARWCPRPPPGQRAVRRRRCAAGRREARERGARRQAEDCARTPAPAPRTARARPRGPANQKQAEVPLRKQRSTPMPARADKELADHVPQRMQHAAPNHPERLRPARAPRPPRPPGREQLASRADRSHSGASQPSRWSPSASTARAAARRLPKGKRGPVRAIMWRLDRRAGRGACSATAGRSSESTNASPPPSASGARRLPPLAARRRRRRAAEQPQTACSELAAQRLGPRTVPRRCSTRAAQQKEAAGPVRKLLSEGARWLGLLIPPRPSSSCRGGERHGSRKCTGP